jgi:N6-L-threonylcarbamoyladenine synthase
MQNDYILGLETSCDETSAAVIKNNHVLANIVSSQDIHAIFGGVVPELASRAHIRLISVVTDRALKKAHISKSQLSGIAVTNGPGLVGALLVGLNFAKGMSQALQIPFIGINHIEGHIYGNFLTNPDISFPHLCLIVSGGHTLLTIMRDHLNYVVIGRTRDDAVGEAFDKGAKMLKLEYPGGPIVDKLAQSGDPDFFHFPRALLKTDHYDFSYSGLKTALLVYLGRHTEEDIKKNMNHICASYQKAAIEVLVKKTVAAAHEYEAQSVGVVGGVAANSLLRNWLKKEMNAAQMNLYLPEIEFCTDNAAMIARAGWQRLSQDIFSKQDLNAVPSLGLEEVTL